MTGVEGVPLAKLPDSTIWTAARPSARVSGSFHERPHAKPGAAGFGQAHRHQVWHPHPGARKRASQRPPHRGAGAHARALAQPGPGDRGGLLRRHRGGHRGAGLEGAAQDPARAADGGGGGAGAADGQVFPTFCQARGGDRPGAAHPRRPEEPPAPPERAQHHARPAAPPHHPHRQRKRRGQRGRDQGGRQRPVGRHGVHPGGRRPAHAHDQRERPARRQQAARALPGPHHRGVALLGGREGQRPVHRRHEHQALGGAQGHPGRNRRADRRRARPRDHCPGAARRGHRHPGRAARPARRGGGGAQAQALDRLFQQAQGQAHRRRRRARRHPEEGPLAAAHRRARGGRPLQPGRRGADRRRRGPGVRPRADRVYQRRRRGRARSEIRRGGAPPARRRA